MVFGKLFGAGASIDTVLAHASVVPGGPLAGDIRITGGSADLAIDGITMELVARVEVESGDSEYERLLPFLRGQVSGPFTLAAGAQHSVHFEFPVPWESPINVLYGHHLPRLGIGVRTELEIARAMDKSDLDPLAIHPLPAQQRLLDALARLGFRFQRADLEQGRVYGSELPFFQEIEFWPAPQYAGGMTQLEVTFIAKPTAMDVLLEVDKRGGFLTAGHDTVNRFTVPYAGAETFDWERWLHERLAQLSQRRSFF